MRVGSVNFISSVNDGVRLVVRIGTRLSSQRQWSPSTSMCRRNGVSFGSRSGSVSAAQTSLRSAGTTASEWLLASNHAIRTIQAGCSWFLRVRG